MIYLSESALKYAVNICEELSNYKVGIVLSSKKNEYTAMQIIRDAITDTEATIYYIINNEHRIDFSNGSTIQFMTASGRIRDYVPHLLIVEHNIDRDSLNRIL